MNAAQQRARVDLRVTGLENRDWRAIPRSRDPIRIPRDSGTSRPTASLPRLEPLDPGFAEVNGFVRLEVLGVQAPFEPQAIDQRREPNRRQSQIEPELSCFSFKVGQHSSQQIDVTMVRLALNPLDFLRETIHSPEHHPYGKDVAVEIRRGKRRVEEGPQLLAR
jgi:hypothetical protein